MSECSLAQNLAIELDTMCSKNSKFPQRQWVYGDEGKVFVRVTQRMIENGELHPTIDLSSVEIDENFQNQGVFKRIVEVVEGKAAQYNRRVFLENILNPVLIAPVQKYGYTQIENSCPPSFVKTVLKR